MFQSFWLSGHCTVLLKSKFQKHTFYPDSKALEKVDPFKSDGCFYC